MAWELGVDVVMTDAGAGHVNRDKEWREDNRYSVLRLSLCHSVDQWRWLAFALQPLVERCHQPAQDEQMWLWFLAFGKSSQHQADMDGAGQSLSCNTRADRLRSVTIRGLQGSPTPLAPPLRLCLLGTLDWCDRALLWPTALAVTKYHHPTGRTGSAQPPRKHSRKRGQYRPATRT